MRFQERVDRILSARNSLLCVGLDPDPDELPRSLRSLGRSAAMRRFLDGIVSGTYPVTAAYKMQLASYLAFGSEGIAYLPKLCARIGSSRLRILDLKANDIPNTMHLFHDGVFDEFGFDAMTITPWMGWESMKPFIDDPIRGFFVVAHSSSAGATDFQEIPTPRGPLWLAVVSEVRKLAGTHGNAGVVIGATYSDAIRAARETLGNGIPILVPGVGAQGGQLSTTVREGVDARGRALLINASRSILYASSGADWKKAASEEAARLATQINQLRAGLRKP